MLPVEIRAADVKAVYMRRYDTTYEEAAVHQRVGVGACYEEDGEGWEEDVYDCQEEAVDHVG